MMPDDPSPTEESSIEKEPGDTLSDRRRKFALGIARGLSARQAAEQAGFSRSYAKKSRRLLKGSAVASEVRRAQTVIQEVAVYDVTAAMVEIDAAMMFAKLHRQGMAVMKLIELKAKLNGLLVERHEIVKLDLRAALEQAKSRVLAVTAPRPVKDVTVNLPGPASCSRGPSLNE